MDMTLVKKTYLNAKKLDKPAMIMTGTEQGRAISGTGQADRLTSGPGNQTIQMMDGIIRLKDAN